MLNGLAPVIIFCFPLVPKGPNINTFVGPPVPLTLTDEVIKALGVPIPIYLDEKLTGVYVDSETKNIDIETTVEAKLENGTPDISQRGLDSVVSVTMKANKGSVVLTAFLALCDLAFQKVASQEYRVSYFNGATSIFNGLLHGFGTSTDADSDLMTITLQISKANQKITPVSTTSVLPKITGAIPIR